MAIGKVFEGKLRVENLYMWPDKGDVASVAILRRGYLLCKKLIVFAGAAALAWVLVGCGGESDGWYAFQGGYINLRNVKTITTHASLSVKKGDADSQEVIDEAITRDSIGRAKDKIIKEYKNNLSEIDYQYAYIAFDGQKVQLTRLTEFKSYKDALNLLDDWLKAVESLELPTN